MIVRSEVNTFFTKKSQQTVINQYFDKYFTNFYYQKTKKIIMLK